MLLPYSRQFYTHPGNLLFSDLSIADYAFNLSRAVGLGTSAEQDVCRTTASLRNSVRALDGLGQRNLNQGMAVPAPDLQSWRLRFVALPSGASKLPATRLH